MSQVIPSSAQGALPACTAVVVSYESATELPECLDALRASTDVALRIELVDNASRDGSAELVRRGYPEVRVTDTGANLGFGRANNLVLSRLETPFVALVNPDAIVSPGAISACVRFLVASPRVAVAASRLVDRDGRLQPSCHAFLDLGNLFGETFLLDRVFPTWTAISSLHMRGFAHDREREVDWVQGAFLVIRSEAIRQVGGFDPDYFMYSEEMDLCYRLRRAGWSVAFLPDPPVIHLGGASSRPMAGPMFVEQLKSRIRFLRIHHGPLVAACGRVLIAISVLGRAAGRHAQALWLRLSGRGLPEELSLRLQMFTAGAEWVFRGLPLTPYAPQSQ